MAQQTAMPAGYNPITSSQGTQITGPAFGVQPSTGSSWENNMFNQFSNMQPQDVAMYQGLAAAQQRQGQQYQGTGGPMTISGLDAIQRAQQGASQPGASLPSGPKYVASQPGPMGQMIRMYGR